MACCQELQTECLKVVNIGYLKTFIGDLIQNNSGETVHIDETIWNNSGYCPTYQELTRSTNPVIQNWKQDTSTPNKDTDGISISGTYRGDQLVRQQDLSVKYTRINKLEIARNGSTNISACGGNATLTYDYKYARNTKARSGTECTSITTSSAVTTGSCTDLAYYTTYGNVTGCTSYTIGKNGTPTASQLKFPQRVDTVFASVEFRTNPVNSSAITIIQDALDGEYVPSGGGKVADAIVITPLTTGATGTTFGCNGGDYEITASGYSHSLSYWKDSCGTEYRTITASATFVEAITSGTIVPSSASCVVSSPVDTLSHTGGNVQLTESTSGPVGTTGLKGHFGILKAGQTDSATITVTYSGLTDSITFTQNCI